LPAFSTRPAAAGLRLAALSLAGHPDPERFAAEFSASERTVAEYLLEMFAGLLRLELRRAGGGGPAARGRCCLVRGARVPGGGDPARPGHR
jgi:hypothetical protein